MYSLSIEVVSSMSFSMKLFATFLGSCFGILGGSGLSLIFIYNSPVNSFLWLNVNSLLSIAIGALVPTFQLGIWRKNSDRGFMDWMANLGASALVLSFLTIFSYRIIFGNLTIILRSSSSGLSLLSGMFFLILTFWIFFSFIFGFIFGYFSGKRGTRLLSLSSRKKNQWLIAYTSGCVVGWGLLSLIVVIKIFLSLSNIRH